MFLFAEAANEAAEHAEEAAHPAPIVVQLVNEWFGEPVYRFQVTYTKPRWDWFLAKFGTNAEAAFGPYTPDNAIPWYTVMFFIACILSVVIIWILKGKLSESEPGGGQQTLEVSVLAAVAAGKPLESIAEHSPERVDSARQRLLELGALVVR